MFPQLYTAASGMVAGERTLELVSNNLANADTPGFKADRALFESYLSDAARRDVPGGNPAAPRGVTVASSWRPEEQGSLRETQNALDLALSGPGWFRVETPQGERLTRDGSFTRGADGKLSTTNGLHVLDANGKPIALPDGQISVAPDGTVTVDEAAVGRLGIASATAQSLVREGETLWRADAPLPAQDMKQTQVRQGYVEQSSVNVVGELASLIQVQRNYEMHQKLLDVTANTVAKKAIELGEPR